MDIGVPYRELAEVDISELRARLEKLTDEDWDARPLRRACLAGGAHNSADSIVLRHEWMPWVSRKGFKTLHLQLHFQKLHHTPHA